MVNHICSVCVRSGELLVLGQFGLGVCGVTTEWGTRLTSIAYRASQAPSGDWGGKDSITFSHGLG